MRRLGPTKSTHNHRRARETLGVIKIVSKGKAGLDSRKAVGFRYLLSQSENGAEEDDEGLEL
jgi:hypothetical protein